MGLDIRLPLGMLFSLLGFILALDGLFGGAAATERSLGYNVDLWWGLVLFVFGLIFLYFGRRGTGTMRSAAVSPEGRAIEAREKREGLERPDPRSGH